MPVTATLETITPAIAEAMLGKNGHNRHLRPTVVARYARDMAAGQWDLNGETIKVAVDGSVPDGQHRLHAVIEANVSIQSIVIRGVDRDTQETMDRGTPRNIADALSLRGEMSATVLAGAISQAIVLRSPNPSSGQEYWPSSREALSYLDLHPAIRESVKVGERVRKVLYYPSTTAAALHFIFSELDSNDADVFWASAIEGIDLSTASPILRLREIAFREITAVRRMHRHRLTALTIKAWNAWRRGTPVSMLVWKTGGAKPEAFPVPE